MNIKTKTPQDILVMREGGYKLIEVLKIIKKAVKPGATLKELDNIAREETKKLGGYPSFLNYKSYPAAICTSVNEGIVHCIPNEYQLKEGDLISIDFGFKFNNFHTDTTISLIVGEDINNLRPLLKAVYSALMAGTKQVKAGVRVGDISQAIETSLKNDNLTIMRQFVGHGIGRDLHEDPIVPNVVGHDKDVVLPAGSVIAIEPIAGKGREAHITAKDDWSIHTMDNQPVAHFEHTVVVKNDGYEIITPINEIIDI